MVVELLRKIKQEEQKMGIDYDKFKRHCNIGVDIKLRNQDDEVDTFRLKPLNIKQFVELNYIQQKEQDGNLGLDEQLRMMDIFKEIVINSYPDLDDDTAENFALNNMTDIMLIMEQLAPRIDERKASQLNKMKALQEARINKQKESVNK